LHQSSIINPFTNSKFAEVFQDREVIVFDSFSAEYNEGFAINFRKKIFKIITNRYESSALIKINEKLTETLSTFLEPEILAKIDHETENEEELCEAIVKKLFLAILKAFFPLAKEESSQLSSKAIILEKSLERKLDMDYLFSQELDLFSNGIAEIVLDFFLEQPEIFSDTRTQVLKDLSSWACGKEGEKDEETKEFLRKLKENSHGRKLVDSIEFVGRDEVSASHLLASKLTQFSKQNKKCLFVTEQNHSILPFVFSILKANKFSYIGPLREPIGCFWKLRDTKGTRSYLLGSIHYTTPIILNLNNTIKKCFKKSQALAVEIDTTREDILSNSSPGWLESLPSSLTKRLPEAHHQNLFNLFSKMYPPLYQIAQQNLMSNKDFIISVFVQLFFNNKKANIILGIDHMLIQEAKSREMPIDDLETFESHMDVISAHKSKSENFDDKMLELLLQRLEKISNSSSDDEFIKAGENFQSFVAKLMEGSTFHLNKAWEEGNLEKMETLFIKNLEPNERITMTTRNLNMAKKMVNLANNGKKYFFVAGVAHTVGQMCIQDFLSSFGWKVERIT
jgi:uncharacterized protein YbaP (TraB family)